jgi:hypothetical protein
LPLKGFENIGYAGVDGAGEPAEAFAGSDYGNVGYGGRSQDD